MPFSWTSLHGGVFVLAALGLAVLYLLACIRAELPRRGTLEWLTLPGRTAPACPECAPLSRKDILPALLTAAIYAAAFVAFFLAVAGDQLFSRLTLNAAARLLLCAVGGGAVFLLARLLTGDRLAAFLGSLLPAADFFHDPAALLLCTVALLLLLLYFARPEGSSGWKYLWPLCLLPAAGAVLTPLLPMVLTLLSLCVLAADRRGTPGKTALKAAVLLLTSALLSAGVLVLWLTAQEQSLRLALPGLHWFSLEELRLLLPVQWPAAAVCAAALPFFLWRRIHRGDRTAVFSLLAVLFLCLLSATWDSLGGIILAAPLALSYLTARLRSRGWGVTAAVGIAIPTALMLLNTLKILF